MVDDAMVSVRPEGLGMQRRFWHRPARGSQRVDWPAELVRPEDDSVFDSVVRCDLIGEYLIVHSSVAFDDCIVPLNQNVSRKLEPCVVAIDHKHEVMLLLRWDTGEIVEDAFDFG